MKALSALAVLLLLSGCTAYRSPFAYKPASINEVRFRDRAVTKSDPEVRVTAAVPTAEETRALFDADLVVREIQPIWVKVENHPNRRRCPNGRVPLKVSGGRRQGHH